MLDSLLRRMIRLGNLTVRTADGRSWQYGDGTGAAVQVRLNGRAARRIVASPELGLGEAYMAGDLDLERGDMWDVFEIIGRNQSEPDPYRGPLSRLMRPITRVLDQWNERGASKKNVEHYNLSYDMYRRFLDADLHYTTAYWPSHDITLEQAQDAKKLHILSKLRLEPGMRVIDLGSGWGGLDIEMASKWGVEVVGVNVAEDQLAVARQRVQAAGLSHRIRYEPIDFRDITGSFDRVVSVGLVEHVGAPKYPALFAAVRRLLKDDGVALIHAIGRSGPPSRTSAFTRKYLFPGGYIPAMSEVFKVVEETGLWVTDLEILRLHYAETLRHWRERFMAERETMKSIYDERFCRMWEFYLAGSEFGFRYSDKMNFQMQLTRRVGALPMTRDYMLDTERAGPPLKPEAIRAAE